MNWKELLKSKALCPFIFGANMQYFTTYKAGGPAEVLALPENETQLCAVKDFCAKEQIPFRIIGLGSNILVSDSGLEGLTCCLKNYTGITLKGKEITALAGTPLDEAARFSAQRGLKGLESLSGIPGSCGGAVFMNAGAFGQETFDKLKCFKFIAPDGTIQQKLKSETVYGYRKVEGLENCLILSATWLLDEADSAELLRTRADILKRRAEKQPLEYPSAGSVFKRPQNDYASRLIDACGLRGLSVGGAKVSEKHAGFIINYNKATATDIFALIEKVRAEVLKQTGVCLQTEQIMWGNFPEKCSFKK